jgi:hypothetical protein
MLIQIPSLTGTSQAVLWWPSLDGECNREWVLKKSAPEGTSSPGLSMDRCWFVGGEGVRLRSGRQDGLWSLIEEPHEPLDVWRRRCQEELLSNKPQSSQA